MTKLQQLHDEEGQSPWLDNLTRDYLRDGTLARMVTEGIRGVTSNPTIFAKAIEGSNAYDDQFADLLGNGAELIDAYWVVVVDDVLDALGVLRPTFDACGGDDGFVSIEVAPDLANDLDGTIQAARNLHERIDRPNLLVKIPATAAGVDAIAAMIAEARSINVTLVFSIGRYAEALRGRAALAQAKVAYQLFRDRFAGERWEALAAQGARPQRPLWASTSTKNPDYPDTLYVDGLIGPDTVTTLPEKTIAAFEDHGTLARTVDDGADAAQSVMDELVAVGIDLDDVGRTLETEGVDKFSASFTQLLGSLETKAQALTNP